LQLINHIVKNFNIFAANCQFKTMHLSTGNKNIRSLNKRLLAFSAKIGCGSAVFMLFLS